MADKNLVTYIISIFVVVMLVSILSTITAEKTQEMRTNTSDDTINSFAATTTSNTTLSPVGDHILDLNATYQNDTWISFDGVDDYLFIQDNGYTTISYWVNDSVTEWTHVVNDTEKIYENNVSVSSFTLNAHKQNATGWYLGVNTTGFFNGSVDTIGFYNTTINQLIVGDLYNNGRV